MGINKLQIAIRTALATAAATAAVPTAWPQTAPAAANENPNAGLEEVVVTGSRITSPNLTAISPITSVDAGYISSTNLTRVEDILNNLPMVFAGQNSTVSNGSDGTASVNLRTNVSDINEVPAALIERVDILTGGASSVYGADAVAGVVNFVLNTHFEGVKIDTSYSYFQHQNNNSTAQAVVSAEGDALPDSSVNTGFGKNVSVLMGSNFADNKGNATFYLTYDKAAAVLEAKYDYAACVLDSTAAGKLTCGGSGTSAKNGAGGNFLAYGSSGQIFSNTVDGKTGAFRPFTAQYDRRPGCGERRLLYGDADSLRRPAADRGGSDGGLRRSVGAKRDCRRQCASVHRPAKCRRRRSHIGRDQQHHSRGSGIEGRHHRWSHLRCVRAARFHRHHIQKFEFLRLVARDERAERDYRAGNIGEWSSQPPRRPGGMSVRVRRNRQKLRALQHLGAEWRDPGRAQLSLDPSSDRRVDDRICSLRVSDGRSGQVEPQVADGR
jgi:hypothetical protein